ncbi:hypothetical protein COV04_02610 [Candidatus Uhrbacteria bacterium CG10_big_fil_rev_8_21_14_0_10_48_11]|uniref:Uncharacterized protein n=1 Tax=Candidatus Uhrbacteria bacterium CG10_big_fil_rev_8_21_14_0_10_48_11 TaxID=1975037 RepID=A0A2M8LED5_9BACT|nr:MAG: hypothetical protein COV04_02610 [Candidatus Uhrbacteria bacterium CG10_big_fil_rev_8_21_14_0_10_48_11]
MLFVRWHRVAWWFIGGSIVLLSCVLFVFFIPKASVTVSVSGEPARTTMNVVLDPSIDHSLPALATIPAEQVEVQPNDQIFPLLVRTDDAQDHFVVSDPLLTTGVAFKKDDLLNLENDELKRLLATNTVLDKASIEVRVTKAVADSGDVLRMNTSVSGLAIPVYDFGSMAKMVAAKKPIVLVQKLMLLRGITDVKISVWPSFWPWLPYRSESFNFTLDIL